MTFLNPREQFATVLVGRPAPSVAVFPNTLRTIAPLAASDTEINRRVVLSLGLKDGMDFLINGSVHVNDKPVKWVNCKFGRL
jgi:hypothetical protein